MQLTIKNIVQKNTQTGKTYWSLDTSEGKMSLWDAELQKKLSPGMVVDAEVEEKNGYHNLRSVNKIISSGSSVGSCDNSIGESAKMKRRCEMMTCAKDIVLFSIPELKATPEATVASNVHKIKLVWSDLMKTIGEPIEVIDGENAAK